MWPYTEREAAALDSVKPRGELAARTLAMPANTNPAGDVFGGWIMSLMDSAGAITATRHCNRRVVTAAVTDMTFLQPVKVGDVVCCYADMIRVGRTSMTLRIEVWVLRQGRGNRVKVTAADYTFVAIDDAGKPCPIGAGSDAALPRQTMPVPAPLAAQPDASLAAL